MKQPHRNQRQVDMTAVVAVVQADQAGCVAS